MEKIVLVDDDPDIRRTVELGLRFVGFQVLTASDGEAGLQLIRAERPRVVLLDLMMPKLHGFALCQEIRKDPELRAVYIIIGSAKTYPADIKKARELGADAYLLKPYDLKLLVETIRQALAASRPVLTATFWGTRGSIATPGPATIRYGGNTACVDVRCGDRIILLDCGTGAREAGLALLREFGHQPLDVHLFVSHTHWDHIQGFPFFAPAYIAGNRISVYSLRGADKSLEKVFTGQMDSNYFPVDLTDLKARLEFIELEGPREIGETKVSYIYLNHPGVAIGFRVEAKGKSVVYLTDHEPYCRLAGDNDHNRKLDREIDEFARDADLYIREAQYTEEEYPAHRGWGHGTWKDAVNSAHAAGVKRLCLYHHDPMHDDEMIDRMVASCHAHMRESGMTFDVFAASDKLRIAL